MFTFFTRECIQLIYQISYIILYTPMERSKILNISLKIPPYFLLGINVAGIIDSKMGKTGQIRTCYLKYSNI